MQIRGRTGRKAGGRGSDTDERGSIRRPRARTVAAAAACLAVGAAFGPSLATAAVESAKDVIVRNDDTQPVPTKVIGTPRVDASGSTVTVQGDPDGAAVPVQVTNQPAGAPAEEHVQRFTPMTVRGGETLLREVLLEVPAGKRFVARQISGEVVTLQEGHVRAQVAAHNLSPSRSFTFSIPLTPALASDTDAFKHGHFNEEMHFEVRGPGEVVGAIARFGPKPAHDMATGWVLVGSLVDCETCQVAEG